MTGAILGVFATLFMDATNTVVARAFHLQRPSVAGLGKLACKIVGAPSDSISDTTAGAVGAACHYTIGAVLGAVFVLWARELGAWYIVPAATIYGLATTIFPWTILFPLSGLGVAASLSPKRNDLRTMSIVGHLAFGLALGLLSLFQPI